MTFPGNLDRELEGVQEKFQTNKVVTKRGFVVTITPELQKKISDILVDLDYSISLYTRLARLNYKFSLLLSYATVVSSLGAGGGGILLGLDGKTTGMLALVPVLIATFAMNLKFQDKANWHYMKKDALNALKRRLLYQLPDNPCAKDVAEISEAWNSLDLEMNIRWEKEFAFNWNDYLKGPSSSSMRSKPAEK